MMIKMTFHTVIFSASNSFRQPATVPLSSETHGGDDVAIFAIGPQAHLFQGVYEQHYIAHVMAYAACIGPRLKFCDNEETNSSSSTVTTASGITSTSLGFTPNFTPSVFFHQSTIILFIFCLPFTLLYFCINQ